MTLASFYRKNKLQIATWAYWTLLLYIIAALVWWFVELNQQSSEMYLFKQELLSPSDPNYQAKLNFIEEERRRNLAQYLGEGLTFLALLLVGAVYVYRAVKKQIRLNEQQQNFMMAVTHELKTPIAITQLNLQTLKLRRLDPSQQEKLIGISLQETGRLNDLCENILLATRIDAGHYLLHAEALDLGEILQDSTANFRSRFPARQITEEIGEGLMFRGDKLLIELLFNNLIENAIKYSPENEPVGVDLHREGRRIRLAVKDNGPGIPPSEREKIFAKFYRIGNEKTRNAKGTGLGLYLSRKIAEEHKAQISVTENTPSGSIFTVEFPAS